MDDASNLANVGGSADEISVWLPDKRYFESDPDEMAYDQRRNLLIESQNCDLVAELLTYKAEVGGPPRQQEASQRHASP